jgi:hypothetical protein
VGPSSERIRIRTPWALPLGLGPPAQSCIIRRRSSAHFAWLYGLEVTRTTTDRATDTPASDPSLALPATQAAFDRAAAHGASHPHFDRPRYLLSCIGFAITVLAARIDRYGHGALPCWVGSMGPWPPWACVRGATHDWRAGIRSSDAAAVVDGIEMKPDPDRSEERPAEAHLSRDAGEKK